MECLREELDDYMGSVNSSSNLSIESVLEKQKRIKWMEEENICVGSSYVGKIIIVDSKQNLGLSPGKRMVLRNIANSISLFVGMRESAFKHSVDLMTDVLHDIRTPLMALNMNASVLQQLNDDMLIKLNLSNNIISKSSLSNSIESSFRSSFSATTVSSSYNSQFFDRSTAMKYQRAVDAITTTASYINSSVDDYASLRKAYSIFDTLIAPNNCIPCDLGQVIEDAYNCIHSPDFTKRQLCIDRDYFLATPVMSYPDALDLLVSLTMKTLLLKYQNISICVCSCHNSHRDNDVIVNIKSSSVSDASISDVDQAYSSIGDIMEGDGEIEDGGANVVNVMLKFSCSHYVNAKTKTSENKDKHIWTGIRMVLEALNGKIQQMGGESAHSSRPSTSAKDSGIEYEVTYEIPFQSARVEVKNRSIYSLDSHEDHVHHLIPNDFHKVPKVCNHVAEAEVRRRMMPATVASDIGEPLLSGHSERRAARKNLIRKAKIPLPVPVHSECDDNCPTSRSDSPPKLIRPDLKCVVVGAKSSSFSSPTAGLLSAALSEVNR